VDVDPGRFLDAIATRCGKLPVLRIAIVGDPARGAALIDAIFEGDRRLVQVVPAADADIQWSFVGGPGILVDEVPHAAIVEQTVHALGAQAAQLQLASLQVASLRAKAEVSHAAIAALAGAMQGLDTLAEFEHQIAIPMTIEALAQIAIAHGLRFDTASYARRERLKDLAPAVAMGIGDVPSPRDAGEAARALHLVGDAFLATCVEVITKEHVDVIIHFGKAVLAALAPN
jgi:hypothetical protein